ncbi:MAG: hypothetical protein E4H26_05510 [Flavobacteriales bacterium]|nr:MAG: hypothetical protein E4H26_05510 [Flavobacteriales bacterium]
MLMNAENDFTKTDQSKKVDQLYLELMQWNSALRFMGDEILFLEHLLNSYAFEPKTPNLFERLLDYQARVKKAKTEESVVATHIRKHKNDLGGMLECTDDACDLTYFQKHAKLKAEWTACLEDFQNLKSEIFNYAGAILKRKKPDL